MDEKYPSDAQGRRGLSAYVAHAKVTRTRTLTPTLALTLTKARAAAAEAASAEHTALRAAAERRERSGIEQERYVP